MKYLKEFHGDAPNPEAYVFYSRNAGHLASGDAERILALLTKLGFPLFVPELLREEAGGERR